MWAFPSRGVAIAFFALAVAFPYFCSARVKVKLSQCFCRISRSIRRPRLYQRRKGWI